MFLPKKGLSEEGQDFSWEGNLACAGCNEFLRQASLSYESLLTAATVNIIIIKDTIKKRINTGCWKNSMIC